MSGDSQHKYLKMRQGFCYYNPWEPTLILSGQASEVAFSQYTAQKARKTKVTLANGEMAHTWCVELSLDSQHPYKKHVWPHVLIPQG